MAGVNDIKIQAIVNAMAAAGIILPGQQITGDQIAGLIAAFKGLDTSDATAAAADILSGKTAYAKGQKVTGTIAGRGASDLAASGAAVSVPAGYYPEPVSKSVAAAEQAVPGISVSSNGLITASATQGAGYVAAGTKSATSQLATQAAATITPGTSAKTAVAAGRYTTGAVQVAGSSNLTTGNIRSGVNIFGVTGTAIIMPQTANITIKSNVSGHISYTFSSNGAIFNSSLNGVGSITINPNINSVIFIIDSQNQRSITISGQIERGLGVSSYGITAYSFNATGSSGQITIN